MLLFNDLPYGLHTFGHGKCSAFGHVRPLLVGFELLTPEKVYDWNNRARSEACLFQYTLSGSGCFEANGQVQRIPVGSGVLLKMPSDTRYFLPDDESWGFVFLKFTGSTCRAMVDSILHSHGHILEVPRDSRPIELMELIFRSVDDERVDGYRSSAMTYEFLMELCRGLSTERRHLPQGIDRGLRLLQRDYNQAWMDVGHLAAASGLSRSHFSREFKRHMGQSPHDAITECRMIEASDLLRSSRMPLSQVSQKVGYSAVSHFCYAFKKFYGRRPGEFRSTS